MKELVVTDKELIQLLLNDDSGEVSESVLTYCDGGLRSLNKMDYVSLVCGMDMQEEQAERLIAAIELGRRVQFSEAKSKLHATSSAAISEYFRPLLSGLQREEFHVLYLNQSLNLIKHVVLSTGGLTGTVIDVRLLFRQALILNACAIVIVHNHPSGNNTPSQADIDITRKIQESGKVMNINLIDHIIIADNSYYSFADDGML